MKISAEIINIGDELLIGQVINTNASYLAQSLNSVGIEVRKVSMISDQRGSIISSLDASFEHAQLTLITGGIGPTNDDITKQVLAEYFDTELQFSEEAYADIEKMFALRDFPVTEINRQQAYLPIGAVHFPNHRGTARGMWFEKDGKVAVAMPGVPFEMTEIMERYVVPKLKEYFLSDFNIQHRTLMITGIGESFLSEIIADWETSLPKNISLAYLPSPGYVRLRLTGKSEEKKDFQKSINQEIEKVKKLIPQYIFAEKDITPETFIIEELSKRALSLATAESCTGGMISHLLTTVPGSSACFKGGIVAYSNEVKRSLLDVRNEDLILFGAVNEQVVRQMAENIRKKFDADYGIATSGIAGPTGGTPKKPVGTVWIAVNGKSKTVAQVFHFGNDRKRNIQRSSIAALDMLRRLFFEEDNTK
jgi:nicotinamide-nucleotide amidase